MTPPATAIAALRGALMAAADVSEADKAMYQTALNNAVTAVDNAQDGIDTDTRRTNQIAALLGASKTLQSALAALGGNPTQALVDAANTALTGLNSAIAAAADLTDDEKATYEREAGNASAPIKTAQSAVDKAKDDADDAANKAMAALAAKLYTGIGATPLTGHAVTINAGHWGGEREPCGRSHPEPSVDGRQENVGCRQPRLDGHEAHGLRDGRYGHV